MSNVQTQSKPENAWVNLIFNVVLPVVILNKIRKYFPNCPEIYNLLIALFFPIAYGVWDYYTRKKMNAMSVIGIVSVLLTGGFALFHLTGFWFVVKEAAIPFVLCIVVFWSAFSSKPLIKVLFFNDSVLNVNLINEKIRENNCGAQFDKHIKNSTLILGGSFLVSALLNYFLSLHIFKEIDATLPMETQTKILNDQIAEMTWISYVVILLPSLICMGFMFWYLFKGIKQMTGLTMEDVMHNMKKPFPPVETIEKKDL